MPVCVKYHPIGRINIVNKKDTEIKFPCRWEYRVIASEAEKSRAALSLISAAENVVLEITSGGVSGGGSYQALRVACEVASLEQAHHLSALFSKAEGVKFVL